MAAVLPGRAPTANKIHAGKVLLVAGSRGLTGAATLASQAAMRAGSGLAILAIPEELNPILEEKLTEVMTVPVPGTPEGSIAAAALPLLLERCRWAHAVAVGPGLGRTPEARRLVRDLLAHVDRPMVLDADALFAMAGEPELLTGLRGPAVITPHEGECARLMGWTVAAILEDRIEAARRVARECRVHVVLKGSPTVVAAPDGRCRVNPTGNPGLASGGTGDVLTGVIVSLLGQGLSPLDAATAGAYVHGRAADLAAAAGGETGLIAGDVVDWLPRARRSLGSPPDAH